MEVTCEPVQTVEDAMKEVPFSLFPTTGLRRDSDGNLTDDALQIVLDGLKSRGYDYMSEEPRKQILNDLAKMKCITQKQYDVLMNEYSARLEKNIGVASELDSAIEMRNTLLADLMRVSRQLNSMKGTPTQEAFIEGWQVGGGGGGGSESSDAAAAAALKEDRMRLQQHLVTRKRMVDVSSEKNRYVSNYLGLYGFLNLAAIGLLLYASGLTSSK